MATEFARRLAEQDVRRARQAIVDLPFNRAAVDKLAQLLTDYQRALAEQRRLSAG